MKEYLVKVANQVAVNAVQDGATKVVVDIRVRLLQGKWCEPQKVKVITFLE